MSSADFRFKQFSIQQDQCAMKVGTDGVLLGAWAGKDQSPKTILDVGTGTGLIALMLAQRFPTAKIEALEIDRNAAEQAKQNVIRSPFHERVNIHHSDFFEWNNAQKFDLVVCNPPFYATAHPAKSVERSIARHGQKFQIREFLNKLSAHLTEDGTLAMILPTSVFESIDDAEWHLSRLCRVFPNPHKPHHRVMAEWQLNPVSAKEEEVTIEREKRHDYNATYRALTREFYLHF